MIVFNNFVWYNMILLFYVCCKYVLIFIYIWDWFYLIDIIVIIIVD